MELVINVIPKGRKRDARFLQRASRPEGPCADAAFKTKRKVPRSYSHADDHPSKPESGLPGAPIESACSLTEARDDEF